MTVNLNMRILIVDDANLMRKIIKNHLLDIGFQYIHEAENGSKAWTMMSQSLNAKCKYDLVIADWNMPELNGLELLGRVRESEDWQNSLFMMVTAEASRDQVIEAVKAGVSGYIVKPFSQNVFYEKLGKVLKEDLLTLAQHKKAS